MNRRLLLLASLLLTALPAWAGPTLHPPVLLRDSEGKNVLETGRPVAPIVTCAGCHDTAFIAANSTHSLGHGSTPVGADCFVCHAAQPDFAQRAAERKRGSSEWSSTATLASTGLVQHAADGWQWNRSAFTPEGYAPQKTLGIQRPRSTHCGQCHGTVHFGSQPLTLDLGNAHGWTASTGEVFSPQRLSASGLNLADKGKLTRPWDIHAERLLHCTDCHRSSTNPAALRAQEDRPAHLRFDARRADVDQFLWRPSHVLVGTSQVHLRCDSCHQPEAAHSWLPYLGRHLQSLSCEACHIPKVNAPAMKQIDATLLTLQGKPRIEYRGVEGDATKASSLVDGYRPVLLPRRDEDGHTRLYPHSAAGTWRWYSGSSPQPIDDAKLSEALIDGGHYQPEILAALDTNGDGELSDAELRLDTPPKVAAVARRLAAVGVRDATVRAEVKSYPLHHGVVSRGWANKDCGACHSPQGSRIAEPLELAEFLPAGVMPAAGPASTLLRDGRLVARPPTSSADYYLAGHHRTGWIDWLGGLMAAGSLVGVSVHAAVRIRRNRA
jgi:hypothetical protein